MRSAGIPDGAASGWLEDPHRTQAARRLVAETQRDSIERLSRLAARLLGTPYAEVNVLTDEHVIVGVHGLALAAGERRSPLEDSLSAVAASMDAPLEVADAPHDPRVATLPPVTRGLVGSYIGTRIVVSGTVVGVLCAYDGEPRAWSPQDVDMLRELSEVVAGELEAGAVAAELADNAVRLNLGFAAASVGSFDWDLRTNVLQWDDRLKQLFGYTPEDYVPHFDSFSARLHPDDRARVDAAIGAAVASRGAYAAEYRVVWPDGSVHWISARGRVLCDPGGEPARMLGAAHDVTAARSAGERVTRHLETMGAAFLSLDRDWTFTYLNTHGEQLFGRSRDELIGRRIWDVYPDLVGTETQEAYERAVREQEPVTFEQHYPPLDVWFDVRAWPSADGLMVYFNDVSDRVRAERAAVESAAAREQALAVAQRATGRSEVLSTASARMAATLEVEEVLAILTDAVLAGLAEWIVVTLADDVVAGLSEHESRASKQLEIVHAAHADPGRDAETRAAVDVEAPPLAGLDPVAGPVAFTAAGVDALALPLTSRGRLLGAVVAGAPARDELDRRLLQDLVMRAGSAVDNAVLYGAERRMGLTLQRSLIPAALPQLPHIQTAARYLPGTKGRHVGGDFYLGHRLQDGRLSLIIGDVMGHGMQAAARMGQLRAILTAYAYDGDPPDRVLTRLAARVEDLLDLPMATVLVSIYDPAARELVAASAGHLPPLIASRDQSPGFVPMRPGPPLGVGPYTYAAHRVVLPADTTAVLYTDGLIEDRRRAIDAGLERLRRALMDLRMPPEAVCRHVLAEMERTEGAEDDIALVVFHHD